MEPMSIPVRVTVAKQEVLVTVTSPVPFESGTLVVRGATAIDELRVPVGQSSFTLRVRPFYMTVGHTVYLTLTGVLDPRAAVEANASFQVAADASHEVTFTLAGGAVAAP